MGDENPIRTLRDYSKPSHEGYRNTIELPVGNNVVPLRFDTIRERTRLRLFQFSLYDQASNWLERLLAGSISTWKDLTTRFLAQFFPSGRTAKLHNDILMFQQHQGESFSEAWTRFKDLLQKVPHHGIDLWLQDARLSKFEADFKQQQSEMTNKIDTVLKAITDRITRTLPSDTVKNSKLNVNSTSSVFSARSYPTKDPQCSTRIHSSINAITYDDSHEEELEVEGNPITEGLGAEAELGVLEWILEEIHVTWAHFKKKRIRLRLYTKSFKEIIIQTVEMASPTLATVSDVDQDDVRSITTASEWAVVCAQLNENRTNKRLKIVGSVVGAGVNVGVDCCGRGVIDGIVGGMVGAAAVHVSEITVT
ncbi:zinc finger, CCHC-type containing protein, partial [Tanacetum coccineum]